MSPIRTSQPIVPATELPTAEASQPFQCSVCQKRFTRHENLRRHYAGHIAAQDGSSYPCSQCSTTFSRLDLRKRHMKRKHPNNLSPNVTVVAGPSSPPTQTHSSARKRTITPPDAAIEDFLHFDHTFQDLADSDHSASIISDLLNGKGDVNNSFNGFPHHQAFPVEQGSGIRRDSATTDADVVAQLLFSLSDRNAPTTSTASTTSPPSTHDPPVLSPGDIATGVDLFFNHVSHFLPFLHRPSFRQDVVSQPLLMSILCLGLQYREDELTSKALASHCFRHGLKLLKNTNTYTAAENLALVQAHILLQVYSIMYTSGPDTSYGLRMHTKSIELARKNGLMDPLPVKSNTTSDLEALWKEWIHAESHKRTLFAAYQLDATWYLMLSIPRSLSHLEIKHDMPCSPALWAAASATDWAHRTLITQASAPSSTRYITAVRTCLSGAAMTAFNSFDAYDLLLVVLFLYSSVREVSGWSTMTGRMCFERFEALHNSLNSLEPLITAQSAAMTDGSQAAWCEATWRMAMIELLNWSSSHTNGVVEGTVDAALASAVYLGQSQSEPVTAHAVPLLEPHLSWFIQYLDRAGSSAQEPPWITVYSFKAFFIAWHLARAGNFDVMARVGLVDMPGIMSWAAKVFGRKSRSETGALVLRSLNSLEFA